MQNMTIEDLDRKIDRKIETLDRKIETLGREMSEKLHERAHQITSTMIGLIVSIWAVTLITASTLYIVTR